MASTADLVGDSVTDLSAKQNEEKTFKQKTFRERLSHIKSVVTVEPILAAYVSAATLCGPALLNLEYEKACRVNLGYNTTVCDAILSGDHADFTDQNLKTVEVITSMHSWQQPLQSVVPLLLVLVLGSYSDRHRWRKPFLILPIIGELLAVVGCLLCVLFMSSWPLEAQGVLQNILPSFFGGQTMLVMAAFAYIADVSSIEMRTLRIGIVQIVLNVCVPVIQLLSGHAFVVIGYYGILCIAGALYAFAVIYGLFCINEEKHSENSVSSCLGELCYPKQAVLHVVDTFRLLFKKSPDNNRRSMVIILVALFIYAGVNNTEGSLFYIYSQSVFGWTPVEYSYFITANTFIHLVGTLVAVPLFTNVLHLSDLMIILITFSDKILGNVLFGLAQSTTMLYVAAAATVVTGVTPIGIRSQATKAVSEHDLGKAQSLFGVCEAVGPAVLAPIYNTVIYARTQATLPSAYLFFGALLFAAGSVLLLCLYIYERKQSSKIQAKPDVTPNNEKPIPMSDIQVTHI